MVSSDKIWQSFELQEHKRTLMQIIDQLMFGMLLMHIFEHLRFLLLVEDIA